MHDRPRLPFPLRHEPRAHGLPSSTFAVAVLVAVACFVSSLPALARQGTIEGTESEASILFGVYESTVDSLGEPGAVTFTDDGELWVCESSRHRIRLFDAAGSALRSIGQFGRSAGDFDRPLGLAIGPDDRIYVADSGNDRIQAFTSKGDFVGMWGERGDGPGQLRDPSALAVHGSSIYVADTGNHRIQVFAPDGTLRRQFGGYGRNDGEFLRPSDLAIDDEGRLFVVDTGNCRIQVFQADGTWIRSFGDYGPHIGLLALPEGVALFEGRVYVADTRNHRIQVFTHEGQILDRWGRHVLRPREGEGKIHYPRRIAIRSDGERAVVVESLQNRLQVFGRGDDPDRSLDPGVTESSMHLGRAAAADRGLLVAADFDSASVLVYDLSRDTPIRISDFAGYGWHRTSALRPSGLHLDAVRKRVVLSDRDARRLSVYRLAYDPTAPLRFDPALSSFVKCIDLDDARPSVDDRFTAIEPGALDVSSDGSIFVCDPRSGRVLVFAPDLRSTRAFGKFGDDLGELRDPSAIALDESRDRVYVADRGRRCVSLFTLDGTAVKQFGARGDGEGEVEDPVGLLATDEGIYVVDRALDRIQHFDHDGGHIRTWGASGLGAGEFFKPSQIVRDGKNRIYVVDLGNHRGQVFTSSGQYLSAFGARLYVRAAERSGE